MARRVKILCDHGVSVDFISDTLTEAADVTGDAGAPRLPYMTYEDALGNSVAVRTDSIIAVLVSDLDPEEQWMLEERLEEKSGNMA